MADNPRRRNPFFPLVAIFGAVFAITVLAALVGATLGDPAAPINRLLDRHAGILIAGEVAAILVSGLLALLIDRRQTLNQSSAARKNQTSPDDGTASSEN